MSNSFPNSWEPYSSQQSAINWRTPATRPSKQTLSDRWRTAQAKVLQPPPQPPPPPPAQPSPKPPGEFSKPPQKNLTLAAFHRSESDHRLLARYESLREDVRSVAESVKHLANAIDTARLRDDGAENVLIDKVSALHAGIDTLREDVRGLQNGQKPLTEKLVNDVVQNLLKPVTNDVQAVLKSSSRVDTSLETIRTDVEALNTGFQRLSSQHTQHVEHLDDLLNRSLVSVVEERVQKLFDNHIRVFDTFLDRVEDIVKPLYDREPSIGTSYRHREEYEPTFRGTEFRETHQRVHLEHPRRDSRAKANDFVIARDTTQRPNSDDAGGGEPSQIRVPSTRGQSIENGGGRPVWARIRIRGEVIDLTKSDESVEEADLFEEDVEHDLGRGVKNENVLADDDGECWSPDNVDDNDDIVGRGRRRVRRTRYFTRSCKKRRC